MKPEEQERRDAEEKENPYPETTPEITEKENQFLLFLAASKEIQESFNKTMEAKSDQLIEIAKSFFYEN